MASKAKGGGNPSVSRKTAVSSPSRGAKALRGETDGGGSSQVSPTFTKEQILGCKRYSQRRDLLTALLEDRAYSTQEVEGAIELYMKKGVN